MVWYSFSGLIKGLYEKKYLLPLSWMFVYLSWSSFFKGMFCYVLFKGLNSQLHFILLALLRYQFSSVQSLSHVWLFATPWITACQGSLSITNSRSLPKLMSIESVMPSNHLILCCPLLLLPPIPPSNLYLTLCKFKVYNVIWYTIYNNVIITIAYLPYLFVVQILKIYFLGNFQVYSAILLTIVTMLCTRVPQLIHLLVENLYPLTNLSKCPHSPDLDNHLYTLCFYQFDVFRFHI